MVSVSRATKYAIPWRHDRAWTNCVGERKSFSVKKRAFLGSVHVKGSLSAIFMWHSYAPKIGHQAFLLTNSGNLTRILSCLWLTSRYLLHYWCEWNNRKVCEPSINILYTSSASSLMLVLFFVAWESSLFSLLIVTLHAPPKMAFDHKLSNDE